jgi:hypothetical protein
MGHPDEIRATKISSRLNKGNKDLTGQVGQADERRFHPLDMEKLAFGKRKAEFGMIEAAKVGRCALIFILR